jgi:hypothetical protein
MDNVATVLVDLAPMLDPKVMLKVVRAGGDIPNAQRLGYLLERARARPQAKHIHEWLKRQSPRAIPLRPGRIAAGAEEDRRWRVLVTEPIEIET